MLDSQSSTVLTRDAMPSDVLVRVVEVQNNVLARAGFLNLFRCEDHASPGCVRFYADQNGVYTTDRANIGLKTNRFTMSWKKFRCLNAIEVRTTPKFASVKMCLTSKQDAQGFCWSSEYKLTIKYRVFDPAALIKEFDLMESRPITTDTIQGYLDSNKEHLFRIDTERTTLIGFGYLKNQFSTFGVDLLHVDVDLLRDEKAEKQTQLFEAWQKQRFDILARAAEADQKRVEQQREAALKLTESLTSSNQAMMMLLQDGTGEAVIQKLCDAISHAAGDGKPEHDVYMRQLAVLDSKYTADCARLGFTPSPVDNRSALALHTPPHALQHPTTQTRLNQPQTAPHHSTPAEPKVNTSERLDSDGTLHRTCSCGRSFYITPQRQAELRSRGIPLYTKCFACTKQVDQQMPTNTVKYPDTKITSGFDQAKSTKPVVTTSERLDDDGTLHRTCSCGKKFYITKAKQDELHTKGVPLYNKCFSCQQATIKAATPTPRFGPSARPA